MTAPVGLVRELLAYRDLRILGHRDWGMIAAFLAGSSLAFPVLAPFAVGSILALAVGKLRALRRRPAIAGITVPAIAPPPGAVTLHGIARQLRGSLSSLLDASPVLLEHAVIKDRRGAVLLRRTEATPFLLDVEGRGPVLVTGVVRFMASHLVAQRMLVVDDPALALMGIPADLAVAGRLEVSSITADGPTLAITGELGEEAVVELAFHRDPGRIAVLRGRVGAPLLIEDRRLIAAAL